MFATTIPLLTKFSAPDQAGVFRGLASTFGGEPDDYGDIVEHGAFAKSLADHTSAGTKPALLFGHDMSQPIGTWLHLSETREGLEVIGKLTLDVAKAREAHALMKDGALALSIGYRVRPGGSEIDKRGVQVLKELDLMEVSAVALPANRNARITQVKGVFNSPQEFERAVRDGLGLSARQAKRLCAGGWSAMVRDEPAASTEPELLAIAKQLQSITHNLKRQTS